MEIYTNVPDQALECPVRIRNAVCGREKREEGPRARFF